MGCVHVSDLLRLAAELRRGVPAVPAPAPDPDVAAWRAATDRARRAGRRATRRAVGGAALATSGALLVPVEPSAGAVAAAGGLLAVWGWRARRRSSFDLEAAGAEPPPLPTRGSLASASLARLERAEAALQPALHAAPAYLSAEVADLRRAAGDAAAEVRALTRQVAVLEQAGRVDRATRERLDGLLSGLVADLHDGVAAYGRLTSAAVELTATARREQRAGTQERVHELTERLQALTAGAQEAAAASRRALGR